MRRSSLVYALFSLLVAPLSQAATYDLAFSTYLGGSDWEHARDVYVDSQGNIYIGGGTTSPDFPTTDGAFQRTQAFTGTQIGSGGYCDGFVSKFSPDGTLLWSTYLGGPNYDRIYAIEVDNDGYVYAAGRAGPGFPVTAGAFQTTFQGSNQGIYGMQNGFVAKIEPDGSGVVWAAYAGVSQLCRDLAVDADGDVYLPMNYQGSGSTPPAAWFANAYRSTPLGGVDVGAMKIYRDGTTVLWATWFGGSANEVNNAGIRIDPGKNVYLNFSTKSTDVPTTAGAHDATFNGIQDAFVAKFSPDGSTLLYGTYFGGSDNEAGNSTHNLAVDVHGNAYLATFTMSSDIPVTAGVVQPAYAGGNTDLVVAKFGASGELLASTYIGDSGADGPDGVYADANGNVFITGSTDSTNFPVTADAWQSTPSTPRDTFMLVLAPDFASLRYSTLLGGVGYDDGRAGFLDARGNLYITGSTNAAGWPILNAWQDTFAGGGGGQELCFEGGCFAGDVILAKMDCITDSVPGDADADGHVDLHDFVILKQTFGQTPLVDNRADFDGDGDVDLNDFVILKQNFGA